MYCTVHTIANGVVSQAARKRNQGGIQIRRHINLKIHLTLGRQYERGSGLPLCERLVLDLELAVDAANRDRPIIRIDRVQRELNRLLLQVSPGPNAMADTDS